jgi:glycosyltransferase involved in cell wall biosynthesis
MVVTHVSFIFGPMIGVRHKLSQMQAAAATAFPELQFVLHDFSRMNLVVARTAGFFKGFFIPWFRCEVLIVRHNFFDPSLLVALAVRKSRGYVTILEHHSDQVVEFQQRGLAGRVLAQWERYCCRRFGRLISSHICVSESVARLQRNYFVRPSIYIMENGFNLSLIREDGETSFPRIVAKERLLLVMCAARFASWHGLDKLISAVKLDPQFALYFDVLLIGEIDPREFPRGFMRMGVLTPSEVDMYIRSADICVDSLNLSSLGLTESSSLKGKQYIAHGKPVLAECSVHAFYDPFTFFLDAAPGFSERLLNWYRAIDFDKLHSVSEVLYHSEICWEAVLSKLRSHLLQVVCASPVCHFK